MSKTTAIDLYSGVGGWRLGLTAAGVEVVRSYEFWKDANQTANTNFKSDDPCIDIRKMGFDQLPPPGSIDFVVGSPPCTEFSYANKAGGGDIDEGLKDIVRFLEVVDYMRPKFWAMENVPRTMKVIQKELSKGGKLERFLKVADGIEYLVVDMTEYGVPQSRKRMIAGRFPSGLLKSYAQPQHATRTLGNVLSILRSPDGDGRIIDPCWDVKILPHKMTGIEVEDFLSDEEARFNHDMKCFHPVWNNMSFPDATDRPARTVTAICTRVSRESIIVGGPSRYRRLCIREKASLQTFPVTFRFYGNSYSARERMVGNAFPPLMSFYVAQSLLETPPERLVSPKEASHRLPPMPDAIPAEVALPTAGCKYKPDRKFRAAIPGLRFGSGTTFDLANQFQKGEPVRWTVRFFHGSSKEVGEVYLEGDLFGDLMKCVPRLPGGSEALDRTVKALESAISGVTPESLQEAWTHRGGGKGPYAVVDALGEAASEMLKASADREEAWEAVEPLVGEHYSIIMDGDSMYDPDEIPKKLRNNAGEIFAGMVVGCWFNTWFNAKSTPLRGLPA
jgi:DNA (cytosine-5)-methyltransferase 1